MDRLGIYPQPRRCGDVLHALGISQAVNTQRHRELAEELKALGVHALGFNQWWVPTVEFGAGGAVVIGFLAPFAARLACS